MKLISIILWQRELDIGAICWGVPRVWCVLRLCWCGVLEVVERLLDVVDHGNLHGTLFVVPVEGYSTVLC
jgi:hypothetical protein